MTVTTAKQELRIAADRALRLFDAGQPDQTIYSFINDMTKDDRTAWIATHPHTESMLRDAMPKGRGALEKIMVGFNVIG
jgi:hypothetical protein